MIIDSSIFVAIAKKEAGFRRYIKLIMKTDAVGVSAATFLETYIVLSHQDPQAWQDIQKLITSINIEIIPFDAEVLEYAMSAYKDYGKGQGGKAQLNYGDCFSYATAKTLGEPLLFIGNDFTHTDIQVALV